MKIFKCLKCKTNILLPDFNEKEKQELVELRLKVSFIEVINRIFTLSDLSPKDSKALYFHMNDRGHCHRCNYKDLVGENVICPKCKSLNLNW